MTAWMVGKSRLSTASTVRRPSPGRPKTLSVTTEPPIRSAMPMPITVRMGTAALRRAWRISTTRLDRLGDQLGPVFFEEEAPAEIALQHVADPDVDLRPDRLFQPVLGAEGGDLLGGLVGGAEHPRRIARRQPQHEEDKDRHHRKNG